MVVDVTPVHEPLGHEPLAANIAMIQIIGSLRSLGFDNSRVGNVPVKDMDLSTPQAAELLTQKELFVTMGTPDHLQFSIVRSNREWTEPLEHMGQVHQIHKHEVGKPIASDLRIYWMSEFSEPSLPTQYLEIRPNTGNILNIDIEAIKSIFDDIPYPVIFRNQDSQRNSESRIIIYRNKAATPQLDSSP